MKYYLYISDAKIDMLYPQVPHEAKKKIASELGFDFKLFKGNRKTETESDESRISRLETVLSFIREFGNVGPIDEPGDYIDDMQPLRLGIEAYGTSGGQGNLIYFGGKTEHTHFGLAGSTRHLIGTTGVASGVIDAPSSVYYILQWLERAVPSSDGELNHSICLLAERARSPIQHLEFFAKTLVYEPDYELTERKTSVVLATPLYIAMPHLTMDSQASLGEP